jgi:hypothetical protein
LGIVDSPSAGIICRSQRPTEEATMTKSARVTTTTILMFVGLVGIGIWQAAFQEGFSWAAWLDSWSFSLLSMLLIIGIFIGAGALLYVVIRRLSNGEVRESGDKEGAKKKIQNAA